MVGYLDDIRRCRVARVSLANRLLLHTLAMVGRLVPGKGPGSQLHGSDRPNGRLFGPRGLGPVLWRVSTVRCAVR